MNHAVITVVFALVGASFGGALLGGGGSLFGLLIGVLAGSQLRLGDRVRRLEEQLRAGVTAPREAAPPIAVAAPPADAAPADEPAAARVSLAERLGPAEAPAEPGDAEFYGPAAVIDAEAEPPAAPPAPREPSSIERGIAWLKNYATTGNVVAKAGVLLLFFGVSFLLKYAIDRDMISIEYRLIAVAVGAVALIVTGWRLRATRSGFAVVLQGGGVGLLYLTIFGAAKLWPVLPIGFALGLMIALVAVSSLLAVLQDARALATLGAIGGFLAPVLMSTGGGSHVALFSYYALLNAGIVGIAWFKAWRPLNLVGFLFTFVIGGIWGERYYQPEFFATTEPFLVLSFLFYLAVSVLFAHRHPPKLRGYVDGTLVFGLPLVVFAMQAALVRDIEFGRAYSALGMGAIYVAVAFLLRKRAIEHMKMLTEALLALGVIALSLAIPYAFDGHITAAGWALEGAGLVWIGVRQQRVLARAFGILLQFAAGFGYFLISSFSATGDTPVLNAQYLGSVFIAAGALFSSRYLALHREGLREMEQPIAVVLLAWGLAWWYGAGIHEIGLHVRAPYEATALLLFFGASVAALAWRARRVHWLHAAHASWLHAPLLLLLAVVMHADGASAGPLADWRFAGWLAVLGGAWYAAACAEQTWSRAMLLGNHALALWLTLFLAAWSLAWAVMQLSSVDASWGLAAWGAMAVAVLVAMPKLVERVEWPLGRFWEHYCGVALMPVVVFAFGWILFSFASSGNSAPLPFLPLANPLDLVSIALLFAVVLWWRQACELEELPGRQALETALLPLVAATGFLWLNVATARAVHALAGVGWSTWSLQHSSVFQGSISVLWSVTALAVMVSASRRGLRKIWMCGAALLGLLVLKLVFVDLNDTGTIGRIVSFIGAGGLFLLIGFLSPVPPRKPALEGGEA